MIRNFTGLPGSGKSYGALLDIIVELTRGNRTVFHQIPIDHGELAVYLKEQGHEPDLSVRLRKIPEDRVRDFWAYADEVGVRSGRLFVIDEAHVYFDARAWAEIGPRMSVYLTQHRHLNDEVLFITQHPEMIDKRIRLLVAQTIAYRNLRTERWLQFFRPPAWMVWSEFYGIPRHGQKPDAIGRRKLVLRIAKCYATSAGHGGLGRSGGPEQDRPTKRLHVGWMSVGAVIVVLLLSFGPEKLMGWTIGRFLKGAKDAAPVHLPQTSAPAPEQHKQPTPQVTRATAATEEPPSSATLETRGITTSNGRFLILLSDGRVITEEDEPYRKSGRLYWNGGRESAILKR